ncbi:MAG: response regulator [Chloroflexi bacterium]|nr:response regulator [Chloroflexota bacterium]MBV9132372.1 response regulator [Chloroflexota bacterium]MBV9895983.1 response regulator [Chloroflexota bacterium]
MPLGGSVRNWCKGPRLTKRILVVEDDDAVRHLLSDALQDAGYAVATAMDGYDALDQIDQHPPDAILLDLMMPSMDGWSFLQQFRGRDCADDIPVGLLSAAPMLLKTADAWGVQVAIGKPFALDTLVSQVERLCEPLVI